MRRLYRDSYSPTMATNDSLIDASGNVKTLATIIIIIIFTIAISFLFFDYQRVVDTQGILVSDRGVVKVYANKGLVIDKLYVSENSKVMAGETLIEFKNQKFNADGDDVLKMKYDINEDTIKSIKKEIKNTIELYSILNEKITERTKQNNKEIEIIKEEILLTKENVDIIDDKISMYEELQKNKHISIASLLDQKNIKVNLLARIKQLERDIHLVTKENNILSKDADELEKTKSLSISKLERDIKELHMISTEINAYENSILKAPIDGIVTMLNVNTGYETGDFPLFTIVPNGASLHAEIYLPSQKISWVSNNADLKLRYHSFPYQKFGDFGGKITKISPVPVPFTQLSEIAKESLILDKSKSYYKLTADVFNKETANNEIIKMLTPSMSFDVSIKGEKMMFYEWLLLDNQ